LFFASAEALGIIGAIRTAGESGRGFEYSQLVGIEVNCADSAYLGTQEYVIHGDSLGRVYRQESGNLFDTTPIFSLYQTPYLYMDDPIVRKIYYDVNTYMRSEGKVEIFLGIDYNYGDSDVNKPVDYDITTAGAAAFWGLATYDTTDIYDGNPSPVRKTNIQGSGDSISLTYVTLENQPSHTIQSFVISYALADRR
jgi:hypothetical protein